jgi:four helix bundle protein
MQINSVKEMDVYQKAYVLAMQVFHVSKEFPPEERYSLTDQVRRASRSVCANLREAWAKRRYESHFMSKLSDCDAENGEVDTWLDFAKDCGYIRDAQHEDLCHLCREVGRMLGSIMKNPKPFLTSDR